tara:strand:+ start:1013 stop:1468 length:456 start_codon:yes stop_codon:yes gene_type:complete
MSWTLTLHGANELPSTINATETILGTIDALTGYTSTTLGYYGASPRLEYEGDDTEYFSGFLTGKNSLRLSIDTQIEAYNYPSTITDYDTLYDFIPVLKTKYKWVEFDASNDNIRFHASGKALLVTIDIKTEYSKELAKLKIDLEMKKALNE